MNELYTEELAMRFHCSFIAIAAAALANDPVEPGMKVKLANAGLQNAKPVSLGFK